MNVSNRVLFYCLLLTTCRGPVVLARGVSHSQLNSLYAFISITLGLCGENVFSEMCIGW